MSVLSCPQSFGDAEVPVLILRVCVADLAFFLSEDCSGDPLLLSPPASALRERPVVGCSNYAAAGITKMSYRVVKVSLGRE
jgi:hypothetical protein